MKQKINIWLLLSILSLPFFMFGCTTYRCNPGGGVCNPANNNSCQFIVNGLNLGQCEESSNPMQALSNLFAGILGGARFTGQRAGIIDDREVSTTVNQPISINLLDALQYATLKNTIVRITVDPPAHGTLTQIGTTPDSADWGKFTYQPNQNYQGNDIFHYTLYDNSGASTSNKQNRPAAVYITILFDQVILNTYANRSVVLNSQQPIIDIKNNGSSGSAAVKKNK